MRNITVVSIIFYLGLILATTAYAQDITKKNVLTMGRFTDKVHKEQKQIEPIITLLASKLRDMGIERGEVVLLHDNETVIKNLKECKLDIVLETPFSAYLYKAKANATPILLASRKGVEEYNSYIFVRRDSGISRLEDLKGKIIAFEDPGSTSAYFLPMVSMELEDMDLVRIDSFDSPVPEDKIGYIFAGSELNISTWVYHNKVNAGALSSTDWPDQKDNPKAYRNEFEVIYETQKVPRLLVIVREGLDKKLVARIKEELLKMNKAEEGVNALKPFKINKFYEPPEGIEGIFKSIEDLLIKAFSIKESR
jgi:phosphonate transport system substrate-binding protein